MSTEPNFQVPHVLLPRRRGHPLRFRGRLRHRCGFRRALFARGHHLGRRRLDRHLAERVRGQAGDQGGLSIPEEGAARVRDKVGHQFAVLNLEVWGCTVIFGRFRNVLEVWPKSA